MIKFQKTKRAFFWTSILRAPFWALYNLLPFILYKDLHATPLQISLFIALKPAVALFSLYWSAHVVKRPDRLKSNIIWGSILAYFPFLFLPWFNGVWFILFASSLFMMMHRGMIPAWMEILKLNLEGEKKQKVFAWGSSISYAIGSLLPFLIGPMMDRFPTCYPWLFLCAALLSIAAFLTHFSIPIEVQEIKEERPKNRWVTPWLQTFNLLKERRDFFLYQVGFMLLGGSGLMLMQPALPRFFIDVLGLSYTELSCALTLCKGVGFVLFSQLWAKKMEKTHIFTFSGLITLLAAFFILTLLASSWSLPCIYVAYLLYGALQGGSELCWHLSGPRFSGDKDSSLFSSVNIVMVGLRGLLIPQVGTLLLLAFASTQLLWISGLLCFGGALFLTMSKKRTHLIKT